MFVDAEPGRAEEQLELVAAVRAKCHLEDPAADGAIGCQAIEDQRVQCGLPRA